MAQRLYLDHAATTPLLPEARAAMADSLERWANPSSPHAEGRAARAALEGARARIGAALGWRHALIFTSGATEALAIALGRARAGPRLVAAVEHDAVLRAAPAAVRIPVARDGMLIPCEVPADALVAVQAVNNETGVIQPLDAIAAWVRGRGGLLLADCAQSAGKLALPQADFIAVSAHKLGGPPGIGALLVRDLATLAPGGGSHEFGYRAGTENLPAILGFAAALEAPADAWLAEQAELRARLDDLIRRAGGEVVCGNAPRSPLIASYRMPGVAAAAQLIRFDLAGIAVSAGSACSSGSIHASHVLKAIGMDDDAAGEVIRVSFGRTTGADDVARFAATWAAMACELRARAA